MIEPHGVVALKIKGSFLSDNFFSSKKIKK